METTNKKHSVADILAVASLSLLSLLAWLAFFSVAWYGRVYGDTGFDSVLYTLTGGLSGVQSGLLSDYLSGALVPALLFTLGTVLILYLPRKKEWMPSRLSSHIFSILLSIGLLVFSAVDIGLVQYVYSQMQLSDLYENEYVDPNTVKITFPEKKRNLIYIYLESMETSYMDYRSGGAMEENLIPELTELARKNLNFSHNNFVGGMVEVPGATWTVGAMVAQTAGIPLMGPSYLDDWKNGYGKDGVFLPGITSLNDILAEAGYYQALMVGSDIRFGGRDAYFNSHQVDKIYDLYTAWEDRIIPNGYFVWWGFEDLHLFDYAKQELTEIADRGQPFAFSMLTVDTHHVGGYKCSLCGSSYEENYDNAIACSSAQVAAFVEWIQQKDFYENTTIIITGDHFSMDNGYFDRNVHPDYVRHGYNCIINAPIEAKNTNNRTFSSLDMFPTTLAAIGCDIQGDRLGFGVNLFSGKRTLLEIFGYDAICAELEKRTEYYERFYEE